LRAGGFGAAVDEAEVEVGVGGGGAGTVDGRRVRRVGRAHERRLGGRKTLVYDPALAHVGRGLAGRDGLIAREKVEPEKEHDEGRDGECRKHRVGS
jgi:hypothetical protein